MKKFPQIELPEKFFSVRHADLDAQYVTVFSFSGAGPVSFGVCA